MTILMTLIDPRKKHRPSRKLKPKLQRMAKANAESQAYPFVAPPSYIQFLDFVYNSAFHSKRFSYVWTRPGPCELEGDQFRRVEGGKDSFWPRATGTTIVTRKIT